MWLKHVPGNVESCQQSPIYTSFAFQNTKKSFFFSVLVLFSLLFSFCFLWNVLFLMATGENHLVELKTKKESSGQRIRGEQASFKTSDTRHELKRKTIRCPDVYIFFSPSARLFFPPSLLCPLDFNQFLHVQEEGAGGQANPDCF